VSKNTVDEVLEVKNFLLAESLAPLKKNGDATSSPCRYVCRQTRTFGRGFPEFHRKRQINTLFKFVRPARETRTRVVTSAAGRRTDQTGRHRSATFTVVRTDCIPSSAAVLPPVRQSRHLFVQPYLAYPFIGTVFRAGAGTRTRRYSSTGTYHASCVFGTVLNSEGGGHHERCGIVQIHRLRYIYTYIYINV